MRRTLWTLVGLLSLLPAPVRAEIQEMRQTIFGMD
jgi:hypothetical protein